MSKSYKVIGILEDDGSDTAHFGLYLFICGNRDVAGQPDDVEKHVEEAPSKCRSESERFLPFRSFALQAMTNVSESKSISASQSPDPCRTIGTEKSGNTWLPS